MKTLVTGGTGVTGSALVNRLLDDGRAVVVLDNKEGYKTDELRQRGAKVVIGTITDAATVARCMEGIQVVHHVAAAFREMHLPDREYAEINIEGTRIVAEAALSQGVRKFVYCSTCGVHGDVERPPATEDSPIAPRIITSARSTRANSSPSLIHERGLPSTILRPNAIYGPGDPGRYYMIFKRVRKGSFPMFGSAKPSTTASTSTISSMPSCSREAGTGDSARHTWSRTNITSKSRTSSARGAGHGHGSEDSALSDLAARRRRTHRGKDLQAIRNRAANLSRRVDWFRLDRAFDIGKAKRELGYRPKVGLTKDSAAPMHGTGRGHALVSAPAKRHNSAPPSWHTRPGERTCTQSGGWCRARRSFTSFSTDSVPRRT